MKASTSRFDSASSLIACCSCGVITSDWDWRRSRRGARLIGCIGIRRRGIVARLRMTVPGDISAKSPATHRICSMGGRAGQQADAGEVAPLA